MKSIVPIITVTLLLCFAGLGQACCPTFWSQFKGGRCYRYVGISMTWFKAREYCYRLDVQGSRLVTLNNDEEANHVHAIFMEGGAEKHSNYWIGLHNFQNGEQAYVWDDKSPYRYSTWAPGEPNNHNEECVEVYKANRKWNDRSCTTERPFFCEISRS